MGVIEVISAALKGSTITRRGVLTIAPTRDCPRKQPPKKKMRIGWEPIAFGDKDLEGKIQLHNDALVVTARISGFLVKKVMIGQGSGADVIYLNLFKGLGLKS